MIDCSTPIGKFILNKKQRLNGLENYVRDLIDLVNKLITENKQRAAETKALFATISVLSTELNLVRQRSGMALGTGESIPLTLINNEIIPEPKFTHEHTYHHKKVVS